MLSANDFIILADRDYQLCKKVENDFPDEYAVSAAAFHIQQAVEKILKALIIINGQQPEFTNNIVKLSVKCLEMGIELPDTLEDVSEALTLWGISSGYDHFVAFSEKKYSKAKSIYTELNQKVQAVLDGIKSNECSEQNEEQDDSQELKPTM